MNSLSSNYLVEDKFNVKCSQLSLNNDCFSIIHLNIRSIPKNLKTFENYLMNLDVQFSVIALSETWLNEINSSHYGVAGYNECHTVRSGKKGGGVSLFVKDHIHFTVLDDISVCTDIIECKFIKIDKCVFGSDQDVIVGVIYRPPNTNISKFNDILGDIIHTVKPNVNKLYLAGDYNINLLNCNEHKPTSEGQLCLF